MQWGSQSEGERAGFHLRSGDDNNSTNDLVTNLEVRIPSEEVLHAMESIREVRESNFQVRRRVHLRYSTQLQKKDHGIFFCFAILYVK